jgi:hypothetical protein
MHSAVWAVAAAVCCALFGWYGTASSIDLDSSLAIPISTEITLQDVGRISTLKHDFDTMLDQAFDSTESKRKKLCKAALEGYDGIEDGVDGIFKLQRRAQRAVNFDSLLDSFDDLEWKRHQASWCAENNAEELTRSPLSDQDECYCTGDQIINCIPPLSEKVLEDFDLIKSAGLGKAAHWAEWYAIFGLTKENCENTVLAREYRRLYLMYRPEKHAKCKTHAHAMSVVHAAGRELLQKHTGCGPTDAQQKHTVGEDEDDGALKLFQSHHDDATKAALVG